MEPLYLKNTGGKSKPIPWFSKKVNLKETFKTYHNELNNIFPNGKTNTKDIAQSLIGEEISDEEWRKLCAATDPRKLKLPTKHLAKHKKSQPSSTGELVTSDEDIPSTSKQTISSNSSKKVPKKVPAREIGHSLNNDVKKPQTNTGITVKTTANKVDKILPESVKATAARKRRNRKKGLGRTLENEVHDQSNASVSTPKSDEVLSQEIEDSKTGKNVQVSKKATLSKTLKTGDFSQPSTSKENIHSILESIPSTSKQQVEPASISLHQATFYRNEEADNERAEVISQVRKKESKLTVKKTGRKENVKETDNMKRDKGKKNNVNIHHDDAAELSLPVEVARNNSVQSKTARNSSEAFEVVSGLLESLIDNITLRCSSTQFDSSDSSDEIKGTENIVDRNRYPRPFRESEKQQTENIDSTKHNYRHNTKSKEVKLAENTDAKYNSRPQLKCMVQEFNTVKTKHSSGRLKTDKVQEAESDEDRSNIISGSTSQAVEDEETDEEESERKYFKDMVRELSRRGGKKMTNKSVRGQIIVDTTRRLGKKDLIPRKNFVVTFRIHRPFFHNKGKKNSRPGKCVQELEVLDCQTLADLRSKILCENDFQNLDGDVSDWPFKLSEAGPLSGDKYRSAMFYIDNTFYVDSQDGTLDYSEEIREWAEDHGIKLGDTKPMEEAKVEDLVVRFGYPYLFMHQGNCQHIIIISDARLLTENNSLYSSDYPNLTKLTKSKTYYCVICTKRPAQWLVYGSDRMLNDTNFMCDKCFYGYHYKGTEKIGRFKAYHWKQRSVLFY